MFGDISTSSWKETISSFEVRNMCARPFAQHRHHLIMHSYSRGIYAYTKSAARHAEPNENHSPNPHSGLSLHTRMHRLTRFAKIDTKKEASERLLRREKRWNSIVSLSKHEMQIELNFSFHSISFEKFLAMPLRDTLS